ncbi:MAG TPA: PQQ-dependent sugar dehydrogenase [Chitinophagaceae bacterium]|nr:PQQ-dependent sugar dehydrogenase [Chitinophagaceae bacterium]
MNKPLLLTITVILLFCSYSFSQTNVDAGVRNEVFRKTDLRIGTGPTPRLWDPWEVTYGADDSLWITEAKAYKISKVSPITGQSRVVLDISNGSTFLPAAQQIYNMQYNIGTNNPQGGMMGMAIHPDFFNPVNPKRFIFVAYVYTYDSTKPSNAGVFYTNRLVRFTYNTATNKFDSPMSLCDSLPGSSDHNSGRLIIAPVVDSMYLFYAQGDMGAGQFGNANRTNKAQNVNSYEGKILRFRINADLDAGAYNRWIPSGPGYDGNPFNGASQSAVYCTGIRNNQGFVYANGKLYGTSHGPFTDDELNYFQSGKNYGHPIVIGDSTDANYDAAKAGGSASSLPLIGSEKTNARNLGAAYGNPIFEFYPVPKGTTATVGTVQYIYNQFNIGNQDNSLWPSEGTSGMDYYNSSKIPGWKNSLLIGTLKGGKIIRLNMNAAGTATLPSGTFTDTTSLFRSHNRFRDLAVSSDGLTMYAVIDSSSITSGPTSNNPIISTCAGCVQKYEFLGYNTAGAAFPAAGFTTTLPNTIPIAAALGNQCENGNYVVINAAHNNTNLWVPITDTNSNIIAEIYANGQNLDTVWTSVYRNASGTVRKDGGNRLYGDRNITIKPKTQPGANVAVRIYITNAEFNALNAAPGSGIGGSINNVSLFKNSNNICSSVLSGGTASIVNTITKAAFSGGYVLQSNAVPSFSTFFFANSALTTLPVQMLSFTAALVNNAGQLNWTTASEINTARFEVERSLDGNSYSYIGSVTASGNSSIAIDYSYIDNDAITQSAPIIYYRLKIVDKDGNYDYSNVVTITLADMAGRVTVFPNPATEKTNITVGALTDGQVHWRIVDNAGRTVMASSVQVKKGRNNFQVNVAKLSAGIYHLTVSGAGVDKQVKIQKY